MFFSELAKDKESLKNLGITHILNAAQGKKFNQIDTDEKYYSDIGVAFLGVEAVDFPNYKINKHFTTAANFISQCLDSEGE